MEKLKVWSSPVGHIPIEYGGCEKPQYKKRGRKSEEQPALTTTTPEVVQIDAMPANGTIDFAAEVIQEVFS